jgi:2-haloalkanoic acid dehalogenase type II
VTFDCYGTLIDWRSGIRAELARVFAIEVPAEAEAFGVGDADDADEASVDEEARAAAAQLDELVERYHALELEVQAEGYQPYRDVMNETMQRLGASEADAAGLAQAQPRWKPFPEANAALEEIKGHGWNIAILSNCDRDQIAATLPALSVEFDEVVVAEDVRFYKPALAHWTEFYVRTLADKRRHVHVAASLYHDIAPAARLKLPTVWINRLGEHPGPAPTVQLSDLEGAPAALEGLIA